MLKKPYEISIWKLVNAYRFRDSNGDYLPNNTSPYEIESNSFPSSPPENWHDSETFLKEKKQIVIGSDISQAPTRAFSPKLTLDINGDHKFSFTMYYRYYDVELNKLIDNPYCNEIILTNQTYIKLKYDNEWYDFIVTEIQENSSNMTFTYNCTSKHIFDLSKIGYNVELDSKLKNSIDTVTNLGNSIVEGTGWEIDTENSDKLMQTLEEPLYQCTLRQTISSCYNIFSPVTNVNNETIADATTVDSGKIIYIPYSCIWDREKPIQFIYSDNNNYDNFLDDTGEETGGYKIIKSVCGPSNNWTSKSINYWYRNNNIDFYGIPKDSTIKNGETYYTYTNGNWQTVATPTSGNTYYVKVDSKNDIIEIEKDEEVYTKICPSFINPNSMVISDIYRGHKYINSRISHYDSNIDKYVYECSYVDSDSHIRKANNFYELQYSTTESIKNLITNSSDFQDLNGWQTGDLYLKPYVYSYQILGLPVSPENQFGYTAHAKVLRDSCSGYFYRENSSPINNYYLNGLCTINALERGEYHSDGYDWSSSVYLNGGLQNSSNIPKDGFHKGEKYVFRIRMATPPSTNNEYSSEPHRLFSYRNERRLPSGTSAATANPRIQIVSEKSNSYNSVTEKYSFRTNSDDGVTILFDSNDNGSLSGTWTIENWFIGPINNLSEFKPGIDYYFIYEGNYTPVDYTRTPKPVRGTSYYIKKDGYIDPTTNNNNMDKIWSNDIPYVNLVLKCKETMSFSDLNEQQLNIYVAFTYNTNRYNLGNQSQVARVCRTVFDIQFFKYYLDEYNQIVLPGQVPNSDCTIYNYYYDDFINQQSETTKISSVKDINFLEKQDNLKSLYTGDYVTLSEPDSSGNYTKVQLMPNNRFLKRLTLTGSKSNCYNLLQELCKNFNCNLKINVAHNSDGSLKYYQDSNGKLVPNKKIVFKEKGYIDKNFRIRYGLNLKSIQRTDTSDNIVSKMIVEQNTNKYALDGSCDIQKASENPTGETSIYNFQYYINKNQLSSEVLKNDMYSENYINFVNKLKILNQERDKQIALMVEGLTKYTRYEAEKTVYEEWCEQGEKEYFDLAKKICEIHNNLYGTKYKTSDETLVKTNGDGPTLVTSYQESGQLTSPLTIPGGLTSTPFTNPTTASTTYIYAQVNSDIRIKHNLPEQVTLILGNNPVDNDYLTPSMAENFYFENNNYIDTARTNIDSNNGWIKISNIGAYPSSPKYCYRGLVQGSSMQTFMGETGINIGQLANWSDDVYVHVVVNAHANDWHSAGQIHFGNSVIEEKQYLWSNGYKWILCTLFHEIPNIPTLYSPIDSLFTRFSLCMQNFYALGDNRNTGRGFFKAEDEFFIEMADDIQTTILLYSKLNAYKEKAKKFQELYNHYYNQYLKANQELSRIALEKQSIIAEFETKYLSFIREGVWSSNDYYDENKYYNEGVRQGKIASMPSAKYTFDMIDLAPLPGYDHYKFNVGDRTAVIDTEFFGYKEDGITPYEEQVVINQIEYSLDDPTQNKITIQNYKTAFESLFQRLGSKI